MSKVEIIVAQGQGFVNELHPALLNDPATVGFCRAVAKHNCKGTYEANAERLIYFRRRMANYDPLLVVIVVVNVDDHNGAPLADALMPGFDWQQYRDRGEIPMARGLAVREGIQEILEVIDKEAAEKLRNQKGVAVVVVDHGTAEVYE